MGGCIKKDRMVREVDEENPRNIADYKKQSQKSLTLTTTSTQDIRKVYKFNTKTIGNNKYKSKIKF